MSIHKTPRIKSSKHLEFVSTLPCLVSRIEGVQVCHLRSPCLELGKRHTGGQEKPSDGYVLPMTPEMHAKQHSMNEQAFWKQQGFEWFEVVAIAQALYINSGDEETCRQIIATAWR